MPQRTLKLVTIFSPMATADALFAVLAEAAAAEGHSAAAAAAAAADAVVVVVRLPEYRSWCAQSGRAGVACDAVALVAAVVAVVGPVAGPP